MSRRRSRNGGGPALPLSALIGRLMRFDTLFWELSALSWLLFLPYLLTAHGHLDWTRHAIGRDFVNYWTAAHLMFGPHRLDIFQPALFLGWEHRLFDPALPFHFWSYPPTAFFLIAPLAALPYLPGLAAWSLEGLLLLAPATRRFFEGETERRLCLFAPAAAVNIALGQNGAVTGALLLAGLAFWERRPWTSGVLLGLLAFKPQLAVLLPVAVLAERRWTVMAAAAAATLLLTGLSVVLFGLDAWRGFFGPTLHTQSLMLSQGRGPFQWMMPSAFMAARVMGVSAPGALAVQAPFSLLGGWLVWRAYRSPADGRLKAAVLMSATFLASPQAFNYDLIPATAAALVLLRGDKTLYGGVLASLLFALPLLLLAAEVVHAPLGPPILLLATLRLAGLCGVFQSAKPRRTASRSIAAEDGSNT